MIKKNTKKKVKKKIVTLAYKKIFFSKKIIRSRYVSRRKNSRKVFNVLSCAAVAAVVTYVIGLDYRSFQNWRVATQIKVSNDPRFIGAFASIKYIGFDFEREKKSGC